MNRATHCKFGHEFTSENTYIRPSNGKRACRVCLRAKAKHWRVKHPDKVKNLLHKWYEQNKEYVKETNKKWRAQNIEKYRERKRNWARQHPDTMRKLARKRRALKKSQLGLWWELEERIMPALRQVQQNKCYYCGKVMDKNLPAQHPDREILEHPLPLSREGLHGMNNWVLACFECNSSKGNKTEQEFLEKRNVREFSPCA